MYRVTKTGGVLGLAVWGDPYFGVLNGPATRACQMLIPDCEMVAHMPSRWTRAEEVKSALVELGWRDVQVREESTVWRWENSEESVKYFFDGGHPGNENMVRMFKEKGGDLEELRGVFEKVVVEEYGKEDGHLEGSVPASLATARK